MSSSCGHDRMWFLTAFFSSLKTSTPPIDLNRNPSSSSMPFSVKYLQQGRESVTALWSVCGHQHQTGIGCAVAQWRTSQIAGRVAVGWHNRREMDQK